MLGKVNNSSKIFDWIDLYKSLEYSALPECANPTLKIFEEFVREKLKFSFS